MKEKERGGEKESVGSEDEGERAVTTGLVGMGRGSHISEHPKGLVAHGEVV